MQSREPMTEQEVAFCKKVIIELGEHAAEAVRALSEIGGRGLHKQWANRYIEPWLWHSTILTGTDFEGFFQQRAHSDAQPEFELLAIKMREAMGTSRTMHLAPGDWHLPYTQFTDMIYTLEQRIKISAARCAGVSYLNHGKVDAEKDLARFQKLMQGEIKHWSPLEHVATPFKSWLPWRKPLGNLDGWAQYRHNLRFTVERKLR